MNFFDENSNYFSLNNIRKGNQLKQQYFEQFDLNLGLKNLRKEHS